MPINTMLPPQAPPVKVDVLTGKLVPADTPPPSPSLGFSLWSQDPANSMKVQPSMTAADKPLQPGTSQQPQMASAAANPPPTSTQAAMTPPGGFGAAIAAAQPLGAEPSDSINLPAAPSPVMASSAPPVQSQTSADMQRLQDLQTQGAGLNKIANPWLRGLARVADIAGTVLAPGVASVIPGTTVRNWTLQNMQQGRVANDQAAQAADLAQQTGLAGLAKTQAETQNLLNPPDKPGVENKTVETGDGVMQWNPATNRYDIRVGAGKDKTPEGERPLTNVPNLQKALQDRYNVLNKGPIPAQYILPANATQKDYDRIDKALASVESAKGTKAQQDTANAMRQQAFAIQHPDPLSGTTGDEFLSTLPAGMAAQVKAMAQGEIPLPPAGTRNPQAQQLRTAVFAYDPTVKESRFTAVQSFKTKGDAQTLVQLNAGMEHADRAIENSAKVGFAPMLGNPKLESKESAAYMQDAEFLTGEVGKLVKNGELTVEQGRNLSSGIESSRQSVRDAALQETMVLLGGKVRGLFQKYKNATDQEIPLDKFFNPKERERLTKYGIVNQDQAALQGGGNQMAPPAQGGPKVGDPVTLKDGTTVIVKVVHADGSFD